MPFTPSKRSDIENFRVMKNVRMVNDRVAAGEHIIQMHYGQPQFGAPPQVTEFARKKLAEDPTMGYTSPIGMPALKARIAKYYAEIHGIKDLDPERIIVTIGSSGGFLFSFLACFDEGDNVAVITPTYPAYRNILKSLSLNVIELPTSLETNYQPTLEMLENCDKPLKGIIVNSPSNPTGTMIDPDELEKIAKWCDANNVRLISDEAYHAVTYDTPATTALHFSKNGIITNTFSKYFCMTGWRLGWLVLPDETMIDRIKKLAENLFVAPPTLSQHMALESFNHTDVLDSYVDQYRINQEILKKGLPEAGIQNFSPMQGAFYTYVDISNLTSNSEEFCFKMLDEAKVSVTAGVDFDPVRGHETIRISYAGTPEDMQEACNRLKKWLG